MARRPGPSFRALLFRCGEGAVCEPSGLEDRQRRELVFFLVGSESNVRLEDRQLRELVFLSVQKATLGTGGRGPQAWSVLQGPAVSVWRRRRTSSVPSSPCLSNKKNWTPLRTRPQASNKLRTNTNINTLPKTHTHTPTHRRTHYTHQTTPQIRPISASMQGPPCSGVYKHTYIYIYVAPVQGSAPCPGDYSYIRSLWKLSSMMQKTPRTTGVGGRGRSPLIRRCRPVVVAKPSFSYPGARRCRRPSPTLP